MKEYLIIYLKELYITCIESNKSKKVATMFDFNKV